VPMTLARRTFRGGRRSGGRDRRPAVRVGRSV